MQNRGLKKFSLAIFLLSFAIVSSIWANGKPWEIVRKSRCQADLHDLYFENPELGWIVGSKGTILQTKDSGKTWESQESNTKKDLQDVCFVMQCTEHRSHPETKKRSGSGQNIEIMNGKNKEHQSYSKNHNPERTKQKLEKDEILLNNGFSTLIISNCTIFMCENITK